MATTFTVLDYCLFVAVLFISSLVGIYYLLKEKWQTTQATSDDILMGGRDMPVFPVAMSLVASYMSAITVLGVPTEMYIFGTEYWLLAFSGFMTYPVTCHVFLPFFHNLGLSSAYQYLELRFNRTTRYLASLMFALETLLYMAVVLYAPALALNQVTGLSLWGSILSVGAVVTFYTSMGGLKAVLWTDTIQTIIVIGSLIGVIIIGSLRIGGISEVWRIADLGGRIEFSNFDFSPFTRCTFWGLTIGSFVGQLTIYGANQTMLQRYMSIRNVKNAQISLYISLPATMLLLSIVCISGLVIYATYYDCDPLLDGKIISRDQLLPYYVMEALGYIHGIPGLFVACIFSAALSSISSCLNALSITTLEDLIKPTLDTWKIKPMKSSTEARLAKLLGIVGGFLVVALAFLCSLLGSTVLQIMITVLGIAGGPLLALFLMGMFFPCINSAGAICGFISSSIVVFWIAIGSFVYKAPLPMLEFRTDGCPADDHSVFSISNISALVINLDKPGDAVVPTMDTIANLDQWSGFNMIYTLSFLWYPTVALFVAFTNGILVSWVTGWTKKPISPRFVYPVAENLCCLLPECMMNCFNCRRIWKYNLKRETDLLSDDDDEEDENQSILKHRTKETARLLPNKTHRMDSFETELAEPAETKV